VVIATKGGHYDFSAPDVSKVNRTDVVHDLNESLKTLDLDHIDLYWLHRDDENKDIGEILELMEELAKEGKIRFQVFPVGAVLGRNSWRTFRLLGNWN
jgi:aryl-alcohol dehydrogenase-like predicted oxidoreductase